MKHFPYIKIEKVVVLFLIAFIYSFQVANAQQSIRKMNAMTSGSGNYTSFFKPYQNTNPEVLKYNPGYENDPEIGMIYKETPCDQCFELIGKRTEKEKVFAKDNTGGKELIIQASTAPMHYHDKQGRWRSVHSSLQPGHTWGVYSAVEKEIPLTVDAIHGVVTMGNNGRKFQFNRSLELVYIKPDGTEQSLGIADWSHHTAGDDGVHVTNAWDGIDIEVHTGRDVVETNFWLNKPMPEYADGKLAIRDYMQMDAGLSIYALKQKEYSSDIDIVNANNDMVYRLHRAIGYEKSNAEATLQYLDYKIGGDNVIDINVPGSFLNKTPSSYPVVIDPLVVDSTTVDTTGSSYKSGSPYTSGGCPTIDSAFVPGDITITDVQFSYAFYAPFIYMKYGVIVFNIGSCFAPPGGGGFNCNIDSSGRCYGTDVSIYSDVESCLPKPQCDSYLLPVTMQLFQNFAPTPPCSNEYIYGYPLTPLTILIYGETLEEVYTKVKGSDTITVGSSDLCIGDTAEIYALGKYGTLPLTYVWNPGKDTGVLVKVAPSTTTVYTVTIIDQCGETVDGIATVNVLPYDNPGFTISPNPQCALGVVTVDGLGTSPASFYNWLAPGSANPKVNGTQDWTTTYNTAGTYSIILNFKNKTCLFSDTQQVNITPPPPSITATNNGPACPGGQIILSSSAAFGSSCVWSGPDGYTSTAESPVINDIKNVNAGVYTVSATLLGSGCPTPPASTNVIVGPAIAGFNYGPIAYGCVSDTVSFTNTSQNTNRYLWEFGDGSSDTATNPTHNYLAVFQTTTDTITLYAFNNGCEDSASEEITITPSPPIVLTDVTPSQSIPFGSSVQLNAGGAYYFTWKPDNGTLNNPNVSDPVATPTDSITTYTVYGMTREGCIDSAFITITLYYQPDFLPNAFTPNGDGRNDVFSIGGMKYDKLLDFRIFNRWGNLVFQTSDKSQGWDGTYNGVPQDIGVYNYYVLVVGADGMLRKYKGTVTLLR